jgi:hypothetical protein
MNDLIRGKLHEIDVYRHSEMWCDKFNYRKVAKKIIEKLKSDVNAKLIDFPSEVKEFDSMINVEVSIDDELLYLYWERELAHISFYTPSDKVKVKIRKWLAIHWPNVHEIPLIFQPIEMN